MGTDEVCADQTNGVARAKATQERAARKVSLFMFLPIGICFVTRQIVLSIDFLEEPHSDWCRYLVLQQVRLPRGAYFHALWCSTGAWMAPPNPLLRTGGAE